MKMKNHVLGSVIMLSLFFSCEVFGPQEPEEHDLLDGPVEDLTMAETKRFIIGDEAFNDQIFTVETGLVPIFTGSSCVSCHAGDCTGHTFEICIRFSQSMTSIIYHLNLR